MNLSAKSLKRVLNLWPPFWGAGLKVLSISDDFSHAKITLHLRWYNRNYVGTQYGGSLFSMTDPFYMLLLLKRLGKNYIVWDKSAHIDYIAPGKTRVYAEFALSDDEINNIKQQTASGDKYLPEYKVRIFDENDETVAVVKRTLYIRLKKKIRSED